MKKITTLFLLTVAIAAIFSSCKKDEQSIETPILVLTNSNTNLTSLYPGFESLQYDLQVAPEDAVDGKITIKITTDADPTGFELELTTSAGEYVEGKVKYQYARATGIVYVGNHTNAEAKRIKVDPTGDEIVITAGNNVIIESYPVICTESLKFTFWSTDNTATIFLYGYSYDGSESKQIEVWSTRDDQHVNIDGIWDNPSLYQGLPSFNNYKFNIDFNNGFSYPADTLVGIYPEGDTLFIKYNNKTYWNLYNSSSAGLLEEL
ncbi:MAG: hypothetical protein PHW83_07110 [Bacteroidales bacterium]|nr:hypothetical protein [Bacteroidales bacterium]